MLTFNRLVAKTFSKLVDMRINDMSESILAGKIDDITRYKSMTGTIAGLREAVDLLEEAISLAEGKPREN